MLLVLTYHRIVPDRATLKGFFDITADELDQQLKQAGELWERGAAPGELLGAVVKTSSENKGFLVTFDDGTADHYHVAAPVLERNNVRGVFFCSTNLIGTEGYLSIAQCQELQAQGHSIESHSHDHKKLIGLSGDDLRHQLTESHHVLHQLGLGRWNFIAVPGGYFDANVQSAAKSAGYALLRTLEWGYNRRPAPLQIQSITINRKTAGRWYQPLISPRGEFAKQAFYRGKEWLKNGWLKSLYFRVRDRGKKRR